MRRISFAILVCFGPTLDVIRAAGTPNPGGSVEGLTINDLRSIGPNR